MEILVTFCLLASALGSLEPANYRQPSSRYLPTTGQNKGDSHSHNELLVSAFHQNANSRYLPPFKSQLDDSIAVEARDYLPPASERLNADHNRHAQSSFGASSSAPSQPIFSSSFKSSSPALYSSPSSFSSATSYLPPSLKSSTNSFSLDSHPSPAPYLSPESSLATYLPPSQQSFPASYSVSPYLSSSVSHSSSPALHSTFNPSNPSPASYFSPSTSYSSPPASYSSSAASYSSPSVPYSPSSASYSSPSSANSYSSPSDALTTQYGVPARGNNRMTTGISVNQYQYSSPSEAGYPDRRSYQSYEEPPEPANYNFEYQVNDQYGNDFGHKENRQDEKSYGVYNVLLPDGRKQIVEYEADEEGFKPRISYEEVRGDFKDARGQGDGPY